MPPTSDTHAEALTHAVELWRQGGPDALTHNALAEATGRSKGNLQHYWRRATDLRRAAALALATEGRNVPWAGLEGFARSMPGPAVSMPDDLAVAEAIVWLNRHGTEA